MLRKKRWVLLILPAILLASCTTLPPPDFNTGSAQYIENIQKTITYDQPSGRVIVTDRLSADNLYHAYLRSINSGFLSNPATTINVDGLSAMKPDGYKEDGVTYWNGPAFIGPVGGQVFDFSGTLIKYQQNFSTFLTNADITELFTYGYDVVRTGVPKKLESSFQIPVKLLAVGFWNDRDKPNRGIIFAGDFNLISNTPQ